MNASLSCLIQFLFGTFHEFMTKNRGRDTLGSMGKSLLFLLCFYVIWRPHGLILPNKKPSIRLGTRGTLRQDN